MCETVQKRFFQRSKCTKSERSSVGLYMTGLRGKVLDLSLYISELHQMSGHKEGFPPVLPSSLNAS